VRVQTEYPLHHERQEQPGYFEVPGAHLYTVLHRVKEPMARVLLVGPFASARHYSYTYWVLWARYLAHRGVEVLRYDYRGVGESEGVFEEMSFDHWSEDVQLLAGWLRGRSPDVPLVLHGLEMGAILAARAFYAEIGDLLLLWSPPANANQSLRSELLRWLALEQISRYSGERKPASVFIRELEEGSFLEVAGYRWSSSLWHDSFKVELPPDLGNEPGFRSANVRPHKIVSLGKEAAPLVKSGYLPEEEPKDFTWLFVDNWDWIAANLHHSREGK
jgi:alpha-beta hydrolase superfamily lysophospholipase